ncbi:MAG: DUF4404 family protein [Chitinivibrionales bacterium]
MAGKQLREMLEKLHAQLKNADTIDETSQDLLRTVEDDIHNLLKHSDEELPQRKHHRTLKQRLDEASRQLDSNHPKIADTMRHIINTMNSLGI